MIHQAGVIVVALFLGASAALAWEIPASVQVELVRITTQDQVTLNAALYRPAGARPRKAVLVTHGTGGNFYGGITAFLPPLLAEKGYLGVGMNRRDHDHNYYRSTFEDGLKDLKAGVDFLESLGVQEVFLMGHSLGSTFVPYYMAMSDDPRVKLVGLSGAIHDLRLATIDTHLGSQEKYDEVVQLSKRRLDQGRADELFLVTLFGQVQALSYHTFLNYRGPDSNAVPVRWIPRIQRSLLLLHNTADKLAQESWQAELRRAGGDRMDYIEVVDPDPSHTPAEGHSYLGVEEKVAGAVFGWLEKQQFLP